MYRDNKMVTLLMKLRGLILLSAFLLAACQPAADETLPTLAVLATSTPAADSTEEIQPTDAPEEATTEPTAPAPTETFTPSPSPTSTRRPTITPTFTLTPFVPTATSTLAPEQFLEATETQAFIEAPIYRTFTPAPSSSGQQITTPEQFADIIITESQFQEDLDLLLSGNPNFIQSVVDFVPGSVLIQVTAADGTTGLVSIPITLVSNFVSITVDSVTVNGTEAPQAYVDLIYNEFFQLFFQTLDGIVVQRVGPQQNLEFLQITDSQILASVLVPQ
jgi:hypothetical protein